MRKADRQIDGPEYDTFQYLIPVDLRSQRGHVSGKSCFANDVTILYLVRNESVEKRTNSRDIALSA